MKWLVRGLQRKADNHQVSSPPGHGEGGSHGRGLTGSHRVFVELWTVIMAANKLYQSVKYKVNVSSDSQTLFI